MNTLFVYKLKALRKLYAKFFRSIPQKPESEQNPDKASQLIYEALLSNKPCMIARFGANELNVLVNYKSIKNNSRSIYKFIKGEQFDWWWNDGIIKCLYENAGFFPPTKVKVEQFCELMLQDIPQVDILGSWLPEEKLVENELVKAQKINFELLNPYFSQIPWTKALKGKKVLIVHPFAKDIELQYQKRELIFKDNLLPEFELLTIQAVQSIAGNSTEFKDWFEALDDMKNQIDQLDYDICLVGCGAYGFHLAAHIKRMNKKAVHIGGSLQLLFGIKGKRWENPNYNATYNFAKLMNEHWIYPSKENKPKNANLVEGACYW